MGLLDVPGMSRSQADKSYISKSQSKILRISGIGDSMTAPNSSLTGLVDPGPAVALASDTYSHGMVPWMAALGKQVFSYVYNGGYSGQKTDFIKAQLPALLQTPTDLLIELCGINNITNYLTVYGGDIVACENAVVTDRQAMWDMAKAAGVTTLALSIPPTGNLAGFTSTMRQCVYRVNRRLRNAAATRNDVIWGDIFSIGIDPTSATGYPRTNYSPDSLHPGAKYVYLIGKYLAGLLASRFAPFNGLVSSQLDSTFNDSSSANIFQAANGLFVNGTTGTAGTGASGVVGTGFAVDRGSSTGSPTAVCSIVPAASGIGNAQRVVATAANAGEYIRFLANITVNLTTLPPGTPIRLACQCDVSGQTNLRSIASTCQLSFSGGASVSPLKSNSLVVSATPGQYGPDDPAFSMLLTTPKLYVPLDATGASQVHIEIQIPFSGAGSATVDFSQFSVLRG